MKRTIYFDMDGTIANLYGVKNWLTYLQNEDATPYIQALPMIDVVEFTKVINMLQSHGVKIGIISWLAKFSTAEYDIKVTNAKLNWLRKNLNGIHFDEIHIVPYGTPKQQYGTHNDVLFDDELPNRENWGGIAYNVENIVETLVRMVGV